MGELFACQLHASLAKDLYQSDKTPRGDLRVILKLARIYASEVFSLGRTLPWPQMVEKATGQPLSSKAFAAEFSE